MGRAGAGKSILLQYLAGSVKRAETKHFAGRDHSIYHGDDAEFYIQASDCCSAWVRLLRRC